MILTSGYITLHRATEFEYPFQSAIASLSRVCDEVVVLITEETKDGTEEAVRALGAAGVRVCRAPLPAEPGWDGMLKERARSLCRGRFVIQMDADEEFHPHSVPQARFIIRNMARFGKRCLGSLQFDLVGPDRGVPGQKWRFFVNDGTWKHGIPPWDLGEGGTALKTDGCFPFDTATGQVFPIFVGPIDQPGFWPLVLHSSSRDVFLKMRRTRDFGADAWDRLRTGGWSVESTDRGECRGKTDDELRAMADAWLAKTLPGTVTLPEL